jgi:hypothetical protein
MTMELSMFRVWLHRLLMAVVPALASASPLAWAADSSAHNASSGIVVLDNQGRVLKTLQAPATREELAAKAAEEERLRDKAKADAEQARKDRILLDSYTTEGEIDLARNRASRALEQQMEIARNYIASVSKRIAELQKRKADLGAKGLPPGEADELARLQADAAAQDASLAQKKQDLDRINARYAADKRRWQEIAEKHAAQLSSPTATSVSAK